MRKILASAAVTLALVASAAHAGTPPEPYVKKLNPTVPGAVSTGTIQSDLLANMGAPSSPATSSGMPMVPASDPNAPAAPTSSEPAAAVPDVTASAPVEAMPGVKPGVPVPVYTTMAEAAAAGVDPLGERKPQQASAPTVEAAPPVSSAFELTQPATWLPWLLANKGGLLRFGSLAVLCIAAGTLLGRRRGGTEA